MSYNGVLRVSALIKKRAHVLNISRSSLLFTQMSQNGVLRVSVRCPHRISASKSVRPAGDHLGRARRVRGDRANRFRRKPPSRTLRIFSPGSGRAPGIFIVRSERSGPSTSAFPIFNNGACVSTHTHTHTSATDFFYRRWGRSANFYRAAVVSLSHVQRAFFRRRRVLRARLLHSGFERFRRNFAEVWSERRAVAGVELSRWRPLGVFGKLGSSRSVRADFSWDPGFVDLEGDGTIFPLAQEALARDLIRIRGRCMCVCVKR